MNKMAEFLTARLDAFDPRCAGSYGEYESCIEVGAWAERAVSVFRDIIKIHKGCGVAEGGMCEDAGKEFADGEGCIGLAHLCEIWKGHPDYRAVWDE